MKWYYFIFTLGISFHGINSQAPSTYNAVVVDYYPLMGNSSINANEYVRLIAQVRNSTTEQVNLIVFPEMTLNAYENLSNTTATFLPSGNRSNDVLCNSNSTEYADFLKTLSCAAVQYNINVVVNLWEKETNCTGANCPVDHLLIYYNTNVVLNTNGTVTARYRKWNLFGEAGLNRSSSVDVTTFQINNVTFGMFTCFDIMFGVPALNLTRNLNVKNIIFPTMWFSELPYLTAVQTQQMWAHENDVLLLAAGANRPQVGSGGSGIFVGADGALAMHINIGNSTTVMHYTVPNLEVANTSLSRNVTAVLDSDETIDAAAQNMDSFFLLADPSIKDHNSVVLNTSQSGNITQQVCHGTNVTICCQFDITITVNATGNNTSQYVYHLVAFNGVRTFSGVRDGGLENCAIVACLNSTVNSCGTRFYNYSTVSWPVTFNNISINGNYTNNDTRIQFPNSLLTSIKPIPAQYTTWEREIVNGTVIRRFSLGSAQSRLLTFGIFGRDFSRDTDPLKGNQGNSGEILGVNTVLACVVVFLLFYFKF